MQLASFKGREMVVTFRRSVAKHPFSAQSKL